MSTLLRQSQTQYVICHTSHTSIIADNPIKNAIWDYDSHIYKWKETQESKVQFIHYTLQDLNNILLGDYTKIKDGQGINEEYKIAKEKWLKEGRSDDNFEEEYYSNICDQFEKSRPLFIYDYMWSQHRNEGDNIGYYVYSKIDLKLEIVNLFKILDVIELFCDDGIIVFKNSYYDYPKLLKEYKYNCMYGSPQVAIYVDNSGFGITYINIDGDPN